jgi:hypothetical protein
MRRAAMNGVVHEEPGRSVFEGQVLKIDHDWGDDYGRGLVC